MSYLVAARNIGKSGGAVALPAPQFNAGNTAETAVGTTHDVTVTMGAGTNRRGIAFGFFQNSQNTFNAGTFDFGGANSAMTAVGSTPIVYATNTRIVMGAYHFAIPDGGTGNRVFRLGTSGAVATLIFAYIWNNIGAGNPTVGTPLTVAGAQPTPVNVTAAGAEDLVLSMIGMDINQAASGAWAPTTTPLVTRNLVGTDTANGIEAGVADGLAAGAGTVNGGWTRGAGVPGGTLDMIVHAMVFPRLS